MSDYRRIQFQRKFLQMLSEGINSNLEPGNEMLKVYNECLLENDLKKWWRYLRKVEAEKEEQREQFMKDMFSN